MAHRLVMCLHGHGALNIHSISGTFSSELSDPISILLPRTFLSVQESANREKLFIGERAHEEQKEYSIMYFMI